MYIFKAIFLWMLLFVLLHGCAGKFDLSEHLASQPPIDYSARFNKYLPYKELVKAVYLQEKKSMTAAEFRKYSNAVYLIHKEAAIFTFDELNLPNDVRAKVLDDLEQNKEDLANYYLSEHAKVEPYSVGQWGEEQVINYPYYTSVDKFAEVASANITFILDIFLGFMTRGVVSHITLAAATKPFQIMLYQALLPIAEEMRNQALLLDHINARVKIKKHLRQLIAQLATVEDKFTTEESIHPSRKFLFFKSQAEIKCESTAIVKAGFDLSKKFILDIDPSEKVVKVYLPNPEILSFDVYSIYSSIENGFLIDVDETHVNELQKLLRNRLRRAALQSGILDSAKSNAKDVVERIFRPLMQTPYFNYRVIIFFE